MAWAQALTDWQATSPAATPPEPPWNPEHRPLVATLVAAAIHHQARTDGLHGAEVDQVVIAGATGGALTTARDHPHHALETTPTGHEQRHALLADAHAAPHTPEHARWHMLTTAAEQILYAHAVHAQQCSGTQLWERAITLADRRDALQDEEMRRLDAYLDYLSPEDDGP